MNRSKRKKKVTGKSDWMISKMEKMDIFDGKNCD